jgi:hypothetical protein
VSPLRRDRRDSAQLTRIAYDEQVQMHHEATFRPGVFYIEITLANGLKCADQTAGGACTDCALGDHSMAVSMASGRIKHGPTRFEDEAEHRPGPTPGSGG